MNSKHAWVSQTPAHTNRKANKPVSTCNSHSAVVDNPWLRASRISCLFLDQHQLVSTTFVVLFWDECMRFVTRVRNRGNGNRSHLLPQFILRGVKHYKCFFWLYYDCTVWRHNLNRLISTPIVYIVIHKITTCTIMTYFISLLFDEYLLNSFEATQKKICYSELLSR